MRNLIWKKVQETEENSPRELLIREEFSKHIKSKYKSSNKIVDTRLNWMKFLNAKENKMKTKRATLKFNNKFKGWRTDQTTANKNIN